jgi:hypothetical protein
LISTEKDRFSIVAMQRDNTLGLLDKGFATLEGKQLKKAKFMAKLKETLTQTNSLQFNRCILAMDGNTIKLSQKGHGTKIQLIDNTADFKQSYVQQRARGAYITSICQPEAIFDLSVTAQY